MGDRCYWQAWVRKSDSKRFQEIVYGQVRDKNQIEFTDEMNYGAYGACERAAKEGLVFKVSHGAGGEYGAGEYCAINGKFYTVNCLHDGDIGVPVDDEGEVSKKDLDAVRDYLVALKSVEEMLKGARQ